MHMPWMNTMTSGPESGSSCRKVTKDLGNERIDVDGASCVHLDQTAHAQRLQQFVVPQLVARFDL